MSKNKDFRAPRRRGFDDDGPMAYEPRARGARSFGGGPDMFGGGASASVPRSQPPATGPVIDAVVKWFKADKGYGFVELSGGQGDAFLHANALQSSGHENVSPGSKLKVMVGSGAKGAQVTRVVEVDTSTATPGERPARNEGGGGFGGGSRAPRRAAPDPSSAVAISGRVKWFDESKGFGFVAGDDGGKDVFVHISVLGASGLSNLAEGQAVNMRVVDTPKGREAVSLSV